MPSSRWNPDRFHRPQGGSASAHVSRWGGFLDEMEQFDPAAFGISPREAETMDPAQRLLLEATWRCWEERGSRLPNGLIGRSVYSLAHLPRTTCYFSSRNTNTSVITPHTATGVTQTLLSNRVSYCFGFTGPSLTIDTACSSSLVALHLAVESMRAG